MGEIRKNSPRVSVIMPAYNSEKYIEEAIMSVIGQTYKNWELIVIDDGSSDSTAEIVEKLSATDQRISFYKNDKNMGVARTRNRGFDIAKGEYVALLDSDDIWLPEKLDKQLDLAESTGADIVYCSYSIVDEKGEYTAKDFIVPNIANFKTMLVECVISCSTALLKIDIAKNYCFGTDFYHEDYVFWMKLLSEDKLAKGCTEILAKYRQNKCSRASNKLKSAKNRWLIYRKNLNLSCYESFIYFCRYAIKGLRKYL